MRAKELRFGVIGWGYWGPKIARNLDSLSHAAVTMVADTDAYRLTNLAVNQPWIQTTTLNEDIFRSDVDAIVIATPVSTHFQLAREALLHGKHVLVEKPLTANVSQAEELVALAQEQQRILMVGHTIKIRCCSCARATNSSAWLTLAVRGFSTSTCLPCSNASRANWKCVLTGVAMTMASTSERKISSLSVVVCIQG